MDPPRLPAWRLSLLWHETVLDTVSVDGAQRGLRLRTGDVIDVVTADGHVEVRGERLEAVLAPGQRVRLPAGHVLQVDLEIPSPVVTGSLTVDSTLLHSGMIAVTMTICAVSALWLHPTAVGLEPGGGVSTDHRRWLSLTGGTGSTVGRAVFAVAGRPLELGERFELRAAPGPTASPPPSGPPPERATLESALAELNRALRPAGGHAGAQADPLGEAVHQVSAAPVLGAGVGGLSPRDPIDEGHGVGVVGVGDDRRLLALRRQELRDEQRLPSGKKTYPVTLADVPDALVGDAGSLDATPELDPLVREHLSRMIRTRHNVIRGCYESWGLASNAHQEGRFVLELTLRPDGRVEELHTGRSDPGFDRVGACVVRAASEWYLGDGLVDEPTRLAFPFHLKPRRAAH